MTSWEAKISPTVEVGFSQLKGGTALEVVVTGAWGKHDEHDRPDPAKAGIEGVELTKRIVTYCGEKGMLLINSWPIMGSACVRATREQINELAKQTFVKAIMYANNGVNPLYA